MPLNLLSRMAASYLLTYGEKTLKWTLTLQVHSGIPLLVLCFSLLLREEEEEEEEEAGGGRRRGVSRHGFDLSTLS